MSAGKELDRLAADAELWESYFRDALRSFIRRGDAPADAVANAKQTATLAAQAAKERREAFEAAVNAIARSSS